ncbi:expansin-A10-like [Asparagus officinalis]|uniref:expansin-A10-like n=1 Tax=Asparagus officinalis TaxID=4686 RepID=UPI00098DFF29|nr:expansin-A10-like [Asparagus officinalis]
MRSPTSKNPKTLLLSLLVLLASSPSSPVSAHRSSSSYSSSAFTEWHSAHATYYAAADPRDTIGGVCRYEDLGNIGYGMATTGLSEALYENGQACGGFYEIRCVDELKHCIL